MTRFISIEMKRRGVEISLVIEGESARASRPDPALLKAIARGHRWFRELASGRTASVREVAKREGVYDSYVKRLIPLAPLAPEIVQSICDGSHPATLTAEVLKTQRLAPTGMDQTARNSTPPMIASCRWSSSASCFRAASLKYPVPAAISSHQNW
jgi:hypothetical protein